MTEIKQALFAVKMTRILLGCGEKIKAIALIRVLFGADLREAKDFVDEVQKTS